MWAHPPFPQMGIGAQSVPSSGAVAAPSPKGIPMADGSHTHTSRCADHLAFDHLCQGGACWNCKRRKKNSAGGNRCLSGPEPLAPDHPGPPAVHKYCAKELVLKKQDKPGPAYLPGSPANEAELEELNAGKRTPRAATRELRPTMNSYQGRRTRDPQCAR